MIFIYSDKELLLVLLGTDSAFHLVHWYIENNNICVNYHVCHLIPYDHFTLENVVDVM